MSRLHIESHNIERIGWLRAAVLGANDGIVSTASLIVGVAAAAAGRQEVMLAGVAGLVAGALSMALGCELRVPHGGVFVLPIPNAVTNLGAYLMAIAAGTVVSALALAGLKRPLIAAAVN